MGEEDIPRPAPCNPGPHGDLQCVKGYRRQLEGRSGVASWRPIAAIAALGVAASLTVATVGPARAAVPPSVVVILTDDQRWDTLWAMPTVQQRLVQHGVTFTNAFVVNSLCCPSRASLLTGKYSHSTGVWRNQPPFGGFASFDDTSTLATWLQRSGYTTGLFGKYLNGYSEAPTYVPPGWDRWVSFVRSEFFNYELSVDGTAVLHGEAASDYSTDVLADEVVSFIQSTRGPLFALFTPYAPHLPATPAPRHLDAFADLPRWRPPNYNERNVSDKPAWLQAFKRLTKDERRQLDAVRLDRLRSLLAVDEAVGRIVDALEATGRLSDTVIFFLSDNGFALGEHRRRGKMAPYEESIRVPMVVRYDPLTGAPGTDENLVLNIDVAPTAADLAGIQAPGADGRSIVPLLRSPGSPWRQDFLVERLEKPGHSRVPTYCSVRTQDAAYVLYGSGEEELYDLTRDPYQQKNVVAARAFTAVLEALRSRLKELCQPPPPGFVIPF